MSSKWLTTPELAETVILEAYQEQVRRRRGVKAVLTDSLRHAAQTIARTMTNQRSAKCCLIMCGLCGNGKTTMLYTLREVNAILRRYKLVSMIGPKEPLIIEKAVNLVNLYARNNGDFERMMQTPLLGIDDVGVEPADVMLYGNPRKPLVELLEYRYDGLLPTFISTNMEAKDFRGRYGDRIADRLNEMAEVIVFKDETFRK